MTDPIEEIVRSPHCAMRTIKNLRERLQVLQQRLPFQGRKLRKIREHKEGQCYPNTAGYCSCPDEDDFEDGTANLVCSDVIGSEDGTFLGQPKHKPVLDIDLPCQLVESSPGKFHLYIDHEVDAGAYWHLLDALEKAGICEEGYVSASFRRGYSAVRHPDKLKYYADKPELTEPF